MSRDSIVASAGVSMHSRWVQLSLLHPRERSFLFSFSWSAFLSTSQDDDVILTHFQPWILSHVWPFHHECPRRTCISRSWTCIWLVFLMCMQAYTFTCSRLTVAKFFLFSRIFCLLFLSLLLVQGKFFFAVHLPPLLYVRTYVPGRHASLCSVHLAIWQRSAMSVRKNHSRKRWENSKIIRKEKSLKIFNFFFFNYIMSSLWIQWI